MVGCIRCMFSGLGLMNWVRLGRTLSPFTFNVYIDFLMLNVECRLEFFSNIIAYSDNIDVLSHSLTGL